MTALDIAIEIIHGIYECPFIYNGEEMDKGCLNCEEEPTEVQELECWNKFFVQQTTNKVANNGGE